VLTRRANQFLKQREKSPYDADRDPSFAALPNVIVIDGGKGQLSAGLEALQELRDRGVVVVSLAKRIEEVFLPGVQQPLRLAHDTPELQLLQRLRDEAHRFAIGSHRTRRAMAISANPLDDIEGIGARRRRALMNHFGSAKAVSRAGVEDLKAVDGISAEMAQRIYDHFHERRS
jgi:excinuclease ABC subunit C